MTPNFPLHLDGATQALFIIGDPVAQVKAPAPLTRLLQQQGFNAVLLPLHVRGEDVEDLLSVLLRLPNVAGLIVTVPHKQRVAALLQDKTRAASEAEAVNLVRRTPQGWQGDLQDGTGFVAGLVKNGFDPRGCGALVVGAGGAGNAIAFALGTAGVARLALHDAQEEKAQALVQRLRAHGYPAVLWDGADDAELLVNATPAGMRAGDPLPMPAELLRAGRTVADVIMEPATTPLLALARERGARAVEGRHMMENQFDGMLAFFGAALPSEESA